MKIQNENCFCCTDYSILKLLAVITLIKSCHFFCQVIHNMRHLHFSPTCVYFSNYKWILLLTPSPSILPSCTYPPLPHQHRVSCCPMEKSHAGNLRKEEIKNYQQGWWFLCIKSSGGFNLLYLLYTEGWEAPSIAALLTGGCWQRLPSA